MWTRFKLFFFNAVKKTIVDFLWEKWKRANWYFIFQNWKFSNFVLLFFGFNWKTPRSHGYTLIQIKNGLGLVFLERLTCFTKCFFYCDSTHLVGLLQCFIKLVSHSAHSISTDTTVLACCWSHVSKPYLAAFTVPSPPSDIFFPPFTIQWKAMTHLLWETFFLFYLSIQYKSISYIYLPILSLLLLL